MLTVNQNIAPLEEAYTCKPSTAGYFLRQPSLSIDPGGDWILQNILDNYLKWNRRIEPVRYSYARVICRNIGVAASVAMRFSSATAQSNRQSADYTTRTRYITNTPRAHEIGTITENEMLLEINSYRATNRLNARIEMDDRILNLRSFLGITLTRL